MTPLSVVIPCFDAARYLPLAVRSIVEQGEPCEIIIVDDGSTDDTRAVALDLARANKQVRVLPQSRNAGPGNARNVGLAQARSRHVCFLDADDEYGPGLFAACLGILREQPVLAVVFGIEIIGLPPDLHVTPRQLQQLRVCLPSNLIVKRNFCRHIGGFPTDAAFRTSVGGEDIAFREALARWGGEAMITIEGVNLRHRYRPGGHLDQFLSGRNASKDGDVAIAPLDAHAARVQRRIVDLLSSAK